MSKVVRLETEEEPERFFDREVEKNFRMGILRHSHPAAGTPKGTKYPKMRD
jgi:hypothetical protein